MKRLSLYVFHEKNGNLRDCDKYYLASLREVSEVAVIVNGPISSEGSEFLKESGYSLLCRDNSGYDFAAWKDYLGKNLEAIKANYDEIILCDCSCYGPVFPLEKVFGRMDRVKCDFWGLYRHPGIPGKIPPHLQSYFLVIRGSLFEDSAFSGYFMNLPSAANRIEAVRQETGFTRHFEEKGFVSSSFIDGSMSKIHPDAPLIIPEKLLGLGFPLVRKSIFSADSRVAQFYTDCTYIRKLLGFIENKTDYPSDLIKTDAIRSLPGSRLRSAFHLDYVLNSEPDRSGMHGRDTSESSVAAIVFSYYADLVDYDLKYLSSLPKRCHIYIVVLSEKMKLIWEQRLSLTGYAYEVRIQANRGRNEAAYWLTCRDVISEYDYICLVHDKKTPSAYPPVRGLYFSDHCWNNVLYSYEYVLNVIKLFDTHPELGLLMPTVPMFGDWPNIILNREWGRNREVAEEIYQRLGLSVPFDDHPCAPWGAMFWLRGKAMAAFYRYNWTTDDFPEEPIRVTDGTVLHAMERMYPMIVQDSGYFSAWIIPSGIAATYYDSVYTKALEYKFKFESLKSRYSSIAGSVKGMSGSGSKEPRKEELFFPEGYLEMYKDVARAGADPWRHYVLYGKKEGRDNGLHPDGRMFFPEGYLEMYPDAAQSGLDPWHHYVLKGKKEGRDNGLHPGEDLFFAEGYLELYPDVARSKADPWRHYVLHGKAEGRDSGLLLLV